MKFAIASTLLPLLSTRAEYPGETDPTQRLAWSSNNEATLEFCKSGSSYGYRLPGATTCAFPGPLVRMEKGNTYKLTLRNSAADSSVITNIHTHGLHQVGDGDGDSVWMHVQGGACLDYTWNIRSDHPGGTYWYVEHNNQSPPHTNISYFNFFSPHI